MKKILAITAAVMAFAVACSPYYPWEVEDIQLGATTKSVELGSGLGTCEFDIISNVDYEVAIVRGAEWLSFVDAEGTTKQCTVDDTKLMLDVAGNLVGKRMAIVELRHGARVDQLKIKQTGVYEDFLVMHSGDALKYFGSNNESRIEKGATSYVVRLETTANDQDIKMELIGDEMVHNFRVENHVLYFDVDANVTGQPRIVDATFYIMNGWDERVSFTVRIRQSYN
ncbi:MAG: hypothetical protein IIX82_00295 [Alistipes sp.]|nr:hypothetical protein [Alistipes sp.]